MKPFLLSSGCLELTLHPALGGSMGRFDWHSGDTVHAIFRSEMAPVSPLEAGCFPLVPFCNRIREGQFDFRGRTVRLAPNMSGDASPIHGQAWLGRWHIDRSGPSGATMSFAYPGGEWPWRYEARQTFALDPGGLTVDLHCTNQSADPMPCGLGLHPYFPCSAGTTLATRVEHVWTVDEKVLPIERRPATGQYDISGGPICGRGLDNGYDGWCGAARIETPGLPFQIGLSSPDARFFQIYSPRAGGILVAEPVSHANAALNAPEGLWDRLGLSVLAPGETMSLRMRIDLTAASLGNSGQ